MLRIIRVLMLVALTSCSQRIEVPANVTLGKAPAHPAVGPETDPSARPNIVAVWLSTLALQRGAPWTGTITTSTNAASVEVRTDSFSFSVPRVSPGLFTFDYAIPDLPPFLRRHFVLHVVARNADGDQADETIPIAIE